MLDCTLIIAAGGSGSRFGEGNKLLTPLAGQPLLYHATARLGAVVREVVIAAPEAAWECYRQVLHDVPFAFRFAPGGTTRTASIRSALGAVTAVDGVVAIQDAARPLTPVALLAELCAIARRSGAAIPAHRVTDTIKRIDADGMIVDTVDRNRLAAVETPQVFLLERLRTAYAAIERAQREFTDDAAVMEYAGFPVAVHFHTYPNPKLTYAADLPILARLMDTE